MSKSVKEAVEFLTNSYGDIRAQAVTYAQVLPKKDVEDALAKAGDSSVEAVVLAILLSAYPVEVVTPKAKAVDADSTKQ